MGMRIAALDIGGTGLKSGIWDGTALSELRETQTCAQEGAARLMETVCALLHEMRPFDAVGVSTTGQPDPVSGTIRLGNQNIRDYTGTPVGDILRSAFAVPVHVENDTNAMAVGESRYGAGRGIPDFICLSYGTGIGGAIFLKGELYRGWHGSAAEFGTMTLHAGQAVPGDPYSGGYENAASVTALLAMARRLDPDIRDGRTLFARSAEPAFRELLDHWKAEVAAGLASLIHIFGPGRVILGGGVMEQRELVEEIRELTCQRLMRSFLPVEIVPAQLGNTAGMIGAALLAAEKLCEEG